MKKYLTITTLAVILILVIVNITSISVRLKTLAVTTNILVPQGAWRPLEWLTRAPLQEKHEIKSVTGRTLMLYLYRPKSAKVRTDLVIYTPLIGPGPQDPRLINLADTFARSGFSVVIPWRVEEQQVITPKDVGDVVSTVLFLQNQMGTKKIGLMGLSYGNGPVIVAAADPQLRKNISFVVSFAGYYDLGNAAQFVRSGEFAYAYKKISGVLEPAPYARDIVGKTLAYYGVAEEDFFDSTEFVKLRQALSPSNFLDQQAAEFFILHPTDDRYIPYTESMQLADALKGRVPVTFALTTLFEHGTYKPLTFRNIRSHYLPSLGDFYNFIFTLLARYL